MAKQVRKLPDAELSRTLHLACREGDLEAVKQVLHKLKRSRRTALLNQASYKPSLLHLYQAFINPERREPVSLTGRLTALQRAAERGHTDVVSYLIEMGAEVDACEVFDLVNINLVGYEQFVC
eukprot:m.64068 g.64068  ORF g.64068 m.64068 type:complete len:123 (+) comp13994_c1_seq2:195-563(+)